MCGITGIVKYNLHDNVDSNILEGMTDAIIHRGPDDKGIYLKENVGFGFRRLSIIDLKTGHQPMMNASGNLVIVFNGEIYNYKELRQELISKGYKFHTSTDTEVIINLYEEYGEKSLDYLRGMFAFAIWDLKNKKLFCARDRFGIKPFYYYTDGKRFVFGSEIKSILKCDNINKELNPAGIDSYFAYGYITNDNSIYKAIKKLKAGHSLSINFGNNAEIKIKQHWKPVFETDYSKSEKEWMKELEEVFSESVKMHMVSDVPLGAFLSGGIDSSSVVALMSKHSSQPINTFSIGFKEEKFNELQYARELSKKYGTNHHEQIIEPESIDIISKLVHAYDEPFADSSAIPTYYVSKFAREYVTVALSGDGGDELFAGYDIYQYLQKIHRKSFSNLKLNRLIWGNLCHMLPDNMKGKGITNLLSRNKNYLGAHITIWPDFLRKKLIRNQIGGNYELAEKYKEIILNDTNYDFITNLQNLDLNTYLVDDILTKVDRVSMLNSLEVRVPILDHKLAELSFKIPAELKLKNGIQKYIFKKAIGSYLPESILNHPKQGFAVPLNYWFKDELSSYVNDKLCYSGSKLSKYLNTNVIIKTIKDSKSGNRDFSSRVWSLLFFEEWLEANNL